MDRAWRIVVPVRGRLNPALCDLVFATEADAKRWLASREGQDHVAALRAKPRRREPVLLSASDRAGFVTPRE